MPFTKTRKISHSIALLVCAFAVLVTFYKTSKKLNADEIWFSNLDQDSANLIDSLRWNSHQNLTFYYHPGLGNFVLYGTLLSTFKKIGITPISRFDELQNDPDPIRLLPDLYDKGRLASIVAAAMTSLLFGIGTSFATRRLDLSILAFCLSLGSAGILFQSLVVRSEMASVFFAAIAFSLCCLLFRIQNGIAYLLTIALCSVFLGFSILTKIQTMPFFGFYLVALTYLAYQMKGRINLLSNTSQVLFALTLPLSVFLIPKLIALTLGPDHQIDRMRYVLYTSMVLGIASLVAPFRRFPFWTRLLSSLSVAGFGLMASVPIFYIITRIGGSGGSYVYSMVFDGKTLDSYGTALSSGIIKNVLAIQMPSFLRHYTFESFHFAIIAFAFLFATPKARMISLYLVSCALCMMVFSSLRYYGIHYLIYADIFLNMAIISLLVEWKALKKVPLLAAQRKIFTPLLVLLMVGSSMVQYNFVKKDYPTYNGGLRNLVEFIPFGISESTAYATLMKDKYGSADSIAERVYSDPNLNGSNAGINLIEKLNIRAQYSAFLSRKKMLDSNEGRL